MSGRALALAAVLVLVLGCGSRPVEPLASCSCPDADHIDLRFPDTVIRRDGVGTDLEAVRALCEKFCVEIGVGKWTKQERS